ncbi:hypothetical protein DFH06DRAFT_1308642 [Mycena polygramma]|nr:hypothetical protein DFH06DRAFT_1308642 [Mycena polygramma]
MAQNVYGMKFTTQDSYLQEGKGPDQASNEHELGGGPLRYEISDHSDGQKSKLSTERLSHRDKIGNTEIGGSHRLQSWRKDGEAVNIWSMFTLALSLAFLPTLTCAHHLAHQYFCRCPLYLSCGPRYEVLNTDSKGRHLRDAELVVKISLVDLLKESKKSYPAACLSLVEARQVYGPAFDIMFRLQIMIPALFASLPPFAVTVDSNANQCTASTGLRPILSLQLSTLFKSSLYLANGRRPVPAA